MVPGRPLIKIDALLVTPNLILSSKWLSAEADGRMHRPIHGTLCRSLFATRRSFKASLPQPCHSPRRREACRTCARSSAHPSPRGAKRGRQPWRNSEVGLPLCGYSPSWTFLQQPWCMARIVVHRPAIRQRAIDALKILPAS
jgi:hypothetical protein